VWIGICMMHEWCSRHRLQRAFAYWLASPVKYESWLD
jgi:hypothetical protein